MSEVHQAPAEGKDAPVSTFAAFLDAAHDLRNAPRSPAAVDGLLRALDAWIEDGTVAPDR